MTVSSLSPEFLRRAGRMEEAIAAAARATELAPGDAGAWIVLADTLTAANRPDLATDAWSRALTLDPHSGPALCGKARAVQALGRPAEAATLFEKALVLESTSFDARFGLAMLAFDAGDLTRAGSLVGGLAVAHAASPGVEWLAARLAIARGELEDALRASEPLLARTELGLAQRAETLLLRAQALDGLGRAGEAFAQASEGKAIQKRLFAGRAASHESETRKLDRLAAWFEGPAGASWPKTPGAGAGSRGAVGHVFLVGFPRSGTTLLEQALAGHPEVATLEEAPTLAEPYQAFLASDDGARRLAMITPGEAEAWRARYWRSVRAHGGAPDGRVFIDKAPAGTLNLPIVAALFPRAKVLFAVRDPRAVVLSCFLNVFQLNAMTYEFTDLATAAACYAACMRLAMIYRRRLALEVREVRHESVVANFEAELAAIAAFIGIDFDQAMLDVGATARGRAVRTPSGQRLRAGLDARGLDHWRAYADHLAPVSKVLEPWVRHFGYPEAGAAG